MKIINVKRADIDSVLESNYERYEDADEHVIKGGDLGKDIILVREPVYRVEDIGFIFVEGDYCYYEEDTGEYIVDWSLTLIYEDTEDEDFDFNLYMYFEQDGPSISIYNFMRAMGLE